MPEHLSRSAPHSCPHWVGMASEFRPVARGSGDQPQSYSPRPVVGRTVISLRHSPLCHAGGQLHGTAVYLPWRPSTVIGERQLPDIPTQSQADDPNGRCTGGHLQAAAPRAAGGRRDPDSPGPGSVAAAQGQSARSRARPCHRSRVGRAVTSPTPQVQRKIAAGPTHDALARRIEIRGLSWVLNTSAPVNGSRNCRRRSTQRNERQVEALQAVEGPSCSLPRAFEISIPEW